MGRGRLFLAVHRVHSMWTASAMRTGWLLCSITTDTFRILSPSTAARFASSFARTSSGSTDSSKPVSFPSIQGAVGSSVYDLWLALELLRVNPYLLLSSRLTQAPDCILNGLQYLPRLNQSLHAIVIGIERPVFI